MTIELSILRLVKLMILVQMTKNILREVTYQENNSTLKNESLENRTY